MTWEGVLPVFKPAGMTSHDVVAKVRRIIRERRIGHTGTLDPDVTGVLPLCIGRATRLVEYIQERPKQYEAELTIGIATDTEDGTGTVVDQVDNAVLTEDKVKDTLDSFIGPIRQVPPMYSAVRVGGKRLYELARTGVEVEREPREVRIERIDLLGMELGRSHPTVRFRVTCSKGTYIRTLCVDIGRALGYPAHMSSLVRTETGGMGLDGCLTFEQIEQAVETGELQHALIPSDQAIAFMPSFTLEEPDAVKALQGQAPHYPDGVAGSLYRGYGPADRFLGVFRYEAESGRMKPEKIFQ